MTLQTPVFSRPGTLIGHRGLGAGLVDGCRENTVESFLACARAGVGWVEVDVRRTRDDRLFVVHDAVLPVGVEVVSLTGAEVQAFGAVALEELLDALPAHVGVVFDVKSSLEDAGRSDTATTAALLGVWCSRFLGDRPALAQSFDPGALRHLRAAHAGLALGWLTWWRFPVGLAVSAAAHIDVQVLAVHAGSLSKRGQQASGEVVDVERVVERVHDAGRQLMVWCPPARRVGALAAAGVDALVVDDVPRVVNASRV